MPIKELFYRMVIGMTVATFLSACAKEPAFSEKKPYALELARVRSYFQAQQLDRRLSEMDIQVYQRVLTDDASEESKWYLLLTGAAQDSTELVQLRQTLEEQYQLNNLQLVNYRDLSDHISPVSRRQIKETERMMADNPDIPESIYAMIEKFPRNDQFNIDHVALYNFHEDAVSPGYYQQKLDLPRGVSRRLVAQTCDAFAEVIYKDNLYGDQFTVDILKLSKDHDLLNKAVSLPENSNPAYTDHLTIAWFFARKILQTGRYLTETSEEVQVDSYTDLHGYKVVIEPRRGYVRTYMILVDLLGGYVIFSQSTDKTVDEILAYLADFGRSHGMLDYNEFYNVFFTIPYCLEKEGDVFLGYSSRVLGKDYAWSRDNANWALAMVGHTESEAQFYNTQTGDFWSSSIFDLVTEAKKDYIYEDMYAGHEVGGKERLSINGRTGFYVPLFFYSEVNFAGAGRHIFALGSETMGKSDLIQRAERFQSGQRRKGQDPCGPNASEPAAQEEKSAPPATSPPTAQSPEEERGPTEPSKTPPTTKPTSNPGGAPSPIPQLCDTSQIVRNYTSEARSFSRTFPIGQVSATPEDMIRNWMSSGAFLLPTDEDSEPADCQEVAMDFTFFQDQPVLIILRPDNQEVHLFSLPAHRLHPFMIARKWTQSARQSWAITTEILTESTDPAVAELCSERYWDQVDEVFYEAVQVN